MHALLADLIAFVHLAYVGFVVFGELLIVVGRFRRWRWVRRMGFRMTHVVCTLIPATEGVVGWICPLTEWEFELRRKAGQEAQEGTFLGRMAHDLLFVEIPMETLTVIYVGFALLVLATLVVVPPRRKASLARA